MHIDLARLREMHPRLPIDMAMVMIARAALALGRNGHLSGVTLSVDLDRALIDGILSWPGSNPNDINLHDDNRITEDGAEAVSLAVAHHHRAWRIVRRLQKEEHADWLLEDPASNKIAFEVSGVDRGSIASRLSAKLAQVAKSVDVDQRWAGVVGFAEPVFALHSTKGTDNGN